MPKISIIIRSKDEIRAVEETFTNLLSQSEQDFEIICVDSGSVDGTKEIIRKYRERVTHFIEIKSEEYIPGKVLNNAVTFTSGDYIVFNNADAIPLDNEWLKNLIAPLENYDADIVFARQVAGLFTNTFVQKDCERAFGRGIEHKKWKHFFSLASSAVRKNLLEKYPFDESLQYSEDIEWSLRLKNMGRKIYYEKRSIVEHRHDYDCKKIYKRSYGEGFAEGKIYDYTKREMNFLRYFLKPYGAEVLRDWIYFYKYGEFYSLLFSPVYRMYQKIGMYRGLRDYYHKAKGITS